jgi:hypothetical protein
MDLESRGDLLEYASNFLYIWNMLFCTPIIIGPLYNLYFAVDSESVSSWLFTPPY